MHRNSVFQPVDYGNQQSPNPSPPYPKCNILKSNTLSSFIDSEVVVAQQGRVIAESGWVVTHYSIFLSHWGLKFHEPICKVSIQTSIGNQKSQGQSSVLLETLVLFQTTKPCRRCIMTTLNLLLLLVWVQLHPSCKKKNSRHHALIYKPNMILLFRLSWTNISSKNKI
jgi:hypothetical protein